MAGEDFDPQKSLVEVEHWTGRHVGGVFHPQIGDKVAVVYVEASLASAGEINNLLGQVEAKAKVFRKLVWTPKAETGCKPRVEVMATARTNVPV